MKGKKLVIAMAAFALVAVLIVGAYAFYQKAFAQTDYVVYLWREGQGAVTDATVHFNFDGAGWEWAPHSGSGYYKISTNNAPLYWQIRLDEWANPDYIGLDPWWGYTSDQLLGSYPTQSWEVQPAR